MGGGRGEGGGGDYGANVNRNTPSFIMLDYPRGKKKIKLLLTYWTPVILLAM